MPDGIAIAGEVWSPNLGDPLIHACLRHLVQAAGAHEVRSVDLEGRGAFPPPASGSDRWPLPPLLRSHAWWWLRRRRRQRRWAAELAGCRLLLIGGGQLLSSRGMLFPPRLAALAQVARGAGIPVAIAACGADPPWEGPARRLMRRCFAGLIQAVLVRDRPSAACLARAFPEWPAARIAPDPAVWAGALFGIAGRRGSDAPIGLGVSPLGRNDLDADAAWWSALHRLLSAHGHRCELFGNGADEDRMLCHRVAAATGCAFADWPGEARALTTTVARYRAVVSGRLHAGVAAFATGVPALGISTQPKFEGFWQEVGLPERALGLPRPEVAAERILALAAGDGDPPAALPRARQRIASELDRLLHRDPALNRD